MFLSKSFKTGIAAKYIIGNNAAQQDTECKRKSHNCKEIGSYVTATMTLYQYFSSKRFYLANIQAGVIHFCEKGRYNFGRTVSEC